jgi:hypothetical protein
MPGIDLEFRPTSYFWPLRLETHLLSKIKGADRKAVVRRLIETDCVEEIPEALIRSTLSDAERDAIGRIHPAFMGGEYLPNLRESEVEIARITIASTTQDVTSVYARRGKNRIYYHVVDEYDGDTLSGRSSRTSRRTLTLAKLEDFFNGAWSIFDVLEMNFGRDGFDTDQILDFVSIDSQFYPEIRKLYLRRIIDWAAERRRQASDAGQPADA